MKTLTSRQKQILGSILNQDWKTEEELREIIRVAKSEHGHKVIEEIIEAMASWNNN